MKLKYLLWDSIDEWDKTINEWMNTEFFKLNPDDLTNTTMKYVKSVALMEKGLPPNTVVPLLKEKIILSDKHDHDFGGVLFSELDGLVVELSSFF
ncbi:unnamed protein product [Schistosoma mattheei]|uniref:Uncharacterized protein n=1 Tax=Schistosoma mattheei TaxID=31246 RepID=A0A183PWZ8_9TREM|nr:unnamed protein product [Schistosoma mattheei]